jgi:hypothetical protein
LDYVGRDTKGTNTEPDRAPVDGVPRREVPQTALRNGKFYESGFDVLATPPTGDDLDRPFETFSRNANRIGDDRRYLFLRRRLIQKLANIKALRSLPEPNTAESARLRMNRNVALHIGHPNVFTRFVVKKP